MSDPKTMTPESMDAEADSLEKTAAAYLARAKQLREAARMIRALQGEPLPGSPPGSAKRDLPAPEDNAYNAEMSQALADNSPRPRGAPLKSKGPVARVARILGVSGADVAWLIDVKYQTSRSWDGEDRRVPDDVAPKLEALVASPKAIADAQKRLAKRQKSAK